MEDSESDRENGGREKEIRVLIESEEEGVDALSARESAVFRFSPPLCSSCFSLSESHAE